jgi:membrane-associated phospholipid phosphatase
MVTHPTGLDLWLALKLASFVSLHSRFTSLVEGGIENNVLGGIWFGAALFVLWVRAARTDDRGARLRVLTIFLGSIITVTLLPAMSKVVQWPPPVNLPSLKGFFPDYLRAYADPNSFPSQSTALYASVAAGVYSLRKAAGFLLWILVVVFIALPRMYVGGHYLSDVLVGVLLAIAGYETARRLLELPVTTKIQLFLEKSPRSRFLTEILIFGWIFLVATEFRALEWMSGLIKSVAR